jgi:hypothetical protein
MVSVIEPAPSQHHFAKGVWFHKKHANYNFNVFINELRSAIGTRRKFQNARGPCYKRRKRVNTSYRPSEPQAAAPSFAAARQVVQEDR